MSKIPRFLLCEFLHLDLWSVERFLEILVLWWLVGFLDFHSKIQIFLLLMSLEVDLGLALKIQPPAFVADN